MEGKLTRSKQMHAGRPATAAKRGEKVTLSIRASPELKDRLVAVAEERGVPFSQEAELRLEKSFEKGSLLAELMENTFGAGVAGLLLIIGRVMREAGLSARRQKDQSLGSSWMDDPDAFNDAVIAARVVLDEFRPEGEPTQSKTATGKRRAEALIRNVVNQGAPYPFGEKAWIDMARHLLADLLEQSGTMRAEAKRDAEIQAAQRELKGERDPQ